MASHEKKVVMKLAEIDDRETGGLGNTLEVAINTRVMLRVNDKKTPGLVNGARGTIKDFHFNRQRGMVDRIMVKFDDISELQPIERIQRHFLIFGNHVYRSMFPLIVSYAMTIHKSQSLSLPCVFADIGSEVFCSAMTYVALSRCKEYEGL